MNLPIQRLAMILFAAFALLVAMVSYDQAIAGPRYRDDSRNARVALDRAGRERGGIVTADGEIVAESVADASDTQSFQRTYPHGSLYAHLVGYTSAIFGDSGLERSRAGALASDRDSTISGLLDALAGEDLRAKGLRITVNHELQQIATAALGDQTGAVVALDPATGAVLAMVSNPSFDPNVLVTLGATEAGDALESDPATPLTNRAIRELYAPGSTFKVLTAAAAIESGSTTTDTLFPNPGELDLPGTDATISNFADGSCGGTEQVTFQIAFALSCNTVFGIIGMEVGGGDLVAQAEAAGFNTEVPFEFDVVASAIPTADEFVNDLPAVAQTALGERDVRVTPLQMAMVAAAVANDGVVMTPYLVAEVTDADGQVLETTRPTVWRRAFSPATATVLEDLMERVITSGTGTRASVPRVRVGGKTGTPEREIGAPDAWFIGFGPVNAGPDERSIAVAVLVESGGDAGESATGGTVAAPIAQQLLAFWLAGTN
ncbi:MAG: penicillin-binding transpeptidase domain-containing protein [Acidimicrobiia bacterium]|nr:penicillin-binding transpeptidase domain-containing protein [Acidimicrobiia bacterium]MDH3471393.1 penicillin-binding transpeptidase domain-containing protein [Acidimicrobiia bacterium]